MPSISTMLCNKMFYLFSNIILNWKHPLSIFFLYISYSSLYVHMDWLSAVVKHMISRFMRKLLITIYKKSTILPILKNSIYLTGWTYGMALLRSFFNSDISGDDPDYKDCTFSSHIFFFFFYLDLLRNFIQPRWLSNLNSKLLIFFSRSGRKCYHALRCTKTNCAMLNSTWNRASKS